MAVIDRVKLTGTDWNSSATISGVYPSNSGSFSIANGSVYVAVETGRPGGFQFGDPVPFDPGIGFVLPAGATGVRFKNQDAAKPATITAAIASQGQLVPVGGSATSVSVTASSVITGQVDANGNVTGGTGFTVSKTGTGIYSVSFATPFAAIPVVVAATTPTSLSTVIVNVDVVKISGFQAQTFVTTGGNGDISWNFLAYPVS